MTQPSDPDVSGRYLRDNESRPQRVRVIVEGRSLSLRTLTDRELARWSLDQLKNVSIPIIGRDWEIQDRRVEQQLLRLENDQDYAAIQRLASDLAPIGSRSVKQVLFAGNHTGWPVVLLIILASAITALWQLF